MSVDPLATFGLTLTNREATWPPSKTHATVSPAKTLATFSSAGRTMSVDWSSPARICGGVSCLGDHRPCAARLAEEGESRRRAPRLDARMRPRPMARGMGGLMMFVSFLA
jgi:hypothetical protein